MRTFFALAVVGAIATLGSSAFAAPTIGLDERDQRDQRDDDVEFVQVARIASVDPPRDDTFGPPLLAPAPLWDVAPAAPARLGPRSERALLRHAISGNLATVLGGRYGLTYQFLPLPHHAIVATLYRQSPGLTSFVNGGLLGVGGELGWRVYSGTRGPHGLFVGASAVLAYHTTDSTEWFSSWGGAVDAGWAFLSRPSVIGRTHGGFHLAIGAGLQLLASSLSRDRLTDVSAFMVGGGLAPRIMIALGMAP